MLHPVSAPSPKPTVLFQVNSTEAEAPVAVKPEGGEGEALSSPGPAAAGRAPIFFSLGVTI